MRATGRGRTRRHLDIWPGYVDVLSTLLMVIIFTLMVFVIAQFFLNQALSGRDKALAELNAKVAELGDMLALEKTTNSDLRSTVSELSAELQQSLATRDSQKQKLATAQSEREALAAALNELKAKTAKDQTAAAAAKAQVDTKLEDAYKLIDADRQKVQTLLGDIAVLESLRDELTQKLNASQSASDELTRKLAEGQALANALTQKAASSQSEKDQLQQRLNSSLAETDAAKKMTSEAQLQIELLNRQLLALRQQLARLVVALNASEAETKAKDVQVIDLGKRLNEALANKVEELARYRSEFFGKLREVLGNRPDVQVVGDRFVFQSEVLFDTGSADIAEAGQRQIAAFADTLKNIAARIPPNIDWVLRVDGHTDKRPYKGAYGGNWELSTARAIAVVRFMIEQGIPPNRLAAAGFGEFQPLVQGNSDDDLRRNRRIELKLDQR
jgi:chemotaxis protein MotB